MTLFRMSQRLQAGLTRTLALAVLGLAALAQGASAEDASAPSGEPSAEGATPAVEPASATTPAEVAASTPEEKPAGTPPRRFIPTEQVSEDRAVAFPKDI